MRPLVLLLSLATALPLPAHAATYTFTAPFVSAEPFTSSSGAPPLREADADARGDAATGAIVLSAASRSLNLAPVAPAAFAVSSVSIALGPITTATGSLRVRWTMSGDASARRTATLEPNARSAASIIIAVGTVGSTFLSANPAPVLDDDTVTHAGVATGEEIALLTPDGHCAEAPMRVPLTFEVIAFSSAREVSEAAAAANLTVEQVVVEELPCRPRPPRVDVEVSSDPFAFEPASVTVQAGTEVARTWTGDFPHSVTASNGAFDSGVRSSGSFAHTFPTAGTFAYYCELHGTPDGEGMAGVVTVT